MPGVKSLVDAFNLKANGAFQCSRAYLEHGRPPEMVGKEAQRLTFEGNYSTGAPFVVNSAWMRCDADLDQAVAVVVTKMLESHQ